ncbi:MAG TPA: hypothetical protein VIM58_00205 [Candidatus Methylacidiphilales bacterium]
MKNPRSLRLRLHLGLGALLLGLAALPGAARAQWIGASSGTNYSAASNWQGGVVNDTFTGYDNWAVTNASTSSLTFASGATTLSVATTLLNNLVAGQSISGAGIPSGTTIASIDRTAGTITLSQATTAASSGTYSMGSLGAATGFAITIDTARTLSSFTYASLDPSNVAFTPSGQVWTFTGAAPSLSFSVGGTGVSRTVTFGAPSRAFTLNFASSGGNAAIAVDPGMSALGNGASIDTVVQYASITGAKTFTKSGGGVLNMIVSTAGQTSTISSAVNVTGGILRLSSSTATAVITSGSATPVAYSVYGRGSVLELNQTSAAGGNVLESGAPVGLYGGALGNNSLAGQSVGAVTLGDGRNAIGSYNGTGSSLTLASLTRQNDATVNFIGQNGTPLATTNNKILVTNDANLLSGLVGGGASTGLATSILPWATGATSTIGSAWGQSYQNTDLTGWNGVDFVTYTTATGFRVLSAGTGTAASSTGDYYNADATTINTVNSGGVLTYNVNYNVNANATITASETMNALRLAGTGTLTLNPGVTLNIASGAVLLGGNFTTGLSGGTISTGANALVLEGGAGAGSMTVSSTLTNSVTDQSQVGLIVAASGSTANTGGVVLSGTNTYGGYTLVQGNLVVKSSGALNSAAALRIDNGGFATIDTGITAHVAALTGTGTLAFTSAANANQLVIGSGTGANNTVTVNSGGLLGAGDPTGATRAGTLTLGSNVSNLTFNVGSTFAVDLASGTLFDQIAATASGTNTLTLNGGTLSISLLDGYAPTAGQTWLLTSGFTAESGALSNLLISSGNGYVYSLSLAGANNADLLLTLVSIPEPPVGWLALLGGLALFIAVRRRAVRLA